MAEDKIEDKPKKKEEPKVVELTQIVTQTAEAFKLPTGEVVDLNGYLVWLGNLVYELKKGLL